MDIEEKVKDVVARTLEIDRELVTPELSIGDIPEWNSIGNITLISRLEDEFHVEFPLDRLFELDSIENIVRELKRLSQDV